MASLRGDTTIGARVPINPSGWLESTGHPIGATGLGQIFALVSQLRGECGPRRVANAAFTRHDNDGELLGVDEAIAHISNVERPADQTS